MGYRKLTVYLFTLLFAVLAVVLWHMEPQVETVPVDVIITAAGEERTVTGWKNEDGEYYLFLPGYADPAALRLRLHADGVRIDGKPVEDGMTCEGFSLGEPYSFSFASPEGIVDTVLTFVRSENLPAVYVDTNSGTMEYIHGKKGNQESGRISMYLPDGELAYIGDLDAVNGRGNTWIIPKKSYSLQLSAGADLLGMGQAEKWILVSNAFDASHLRNKLIYDFSDALGLPFSPESRWVDLYLNGEYAGLYLLCERNEFHEQRISLTGEGRYLVSMDNQWRLEENARPFVTTQSGYAFRIHSSQVGEGTLQQLLQSVENAVLAQDGRDPLTGKHWSELIDLDSWARKYLVEEIFGNSDGGAISQYFYGDANEGPVYAGPVWDYDVSIGNSQTPRIRSPQSILAGRSRIWSNSDSQSWYYGLCQQDAFYERMVQLYREDCLPLLDSWMNTRLTEFAAQIEAASAMNQLRWESLGAYQIDAAAETENIRSYMQERINFLNQLWLENVPFHKVLIDAGDGGFTLCFAVRPGDQIPYLPETGSFGEELGWYHAATGELFEITQPIREDMEILLRPVDTLPDSEESQHGDLEISVQDIPFCVLTGILGIIWWTDRKRRCLNRMQENQEEFSKRCQRENK